MNEKEKNNVIVGLLPTKENLEKFTTMKANAKIYALVWHMGKLKAKKETISSFKKRMKIIPIRQRRLRLNPKIAIIKEFLNILKIDKSNVISKV